MNLRSTDYTIHSFTGGGIGSFERKLDEADQPTILGSTDVKANNCCPAQHSD